MQLEQAGVPTVLFTTTAFIGLARLEAKVKGLSEARIITMQHPLGGNTDEEVRHKAEVAYAELLPLITA